MYRLPLSDGTVPVLDRPAEIELQIHNLQLQTNAIVFPSGTGSRVYFYSWQWQEMSAHRESSPRATVG